MIANLVQISSGSWVNPAEVKRIYTCQSFKEDEPDTTYVVCTPLDGGGGGFLGIGSFDHTICSDWPIARIHAALGLVSADDLDAQMEGGQ